jgi:hypothetical protein
MIRRLILLSKRFNNLPDDVAWRVLNCSCSHDLMYSDAHFVYKRGLSENDLGFQASVKLQDERCDI